MEAVKLKIAEFEWDEANINHIANHGIEPEEAEEVLRNRPVLRRSHSGRYVSIGKTDVGRYLAVIFEMKEMSVARVVTARPATDTERRLYRKEMG